jgi:threonyl-tRNA synthetase
VRCVVFDSSESLGRRIVAAHEQRIPLFATVGAKEMASGTVTLRERGGAKSVLALGEAARQLSRRAAV